LNRMNYAKRKASRKLPGDFQNIKPVFLEKLSELVGKHKLPGQLIINWGRSKCVNIVPRTEWTSEESGSRQIDTRAVLKVLRCGIPGTVGML
jgi:hypothetical protein